MPLPLYMDINRPEGLKQQIVTIIQYLEKHYPETLPDVLTTITTIVNIAGFEPKFIPLFYRPELQRFNPVSEILFQEIL